MDELRSAYRDPAAPVGPQPSIPSPAMERASATSKVPATMTADGLGMASAKANPMRPFQSGSRDCGEGFFRHKRQCMPVSYTHASTLMPGIGVDPARRGPDPIGDGPRPTVWMDQGFTLAERD